MTLENGSIKNMKFNVPLVSKYYQLEKDFCEYSAGSIFSVNYPTTNGGWCTFSVHKKYNKETPAKKFGSTRVYLERLNDLEASEIKIDGV